MAQINKIKIKEMKTQTGTQGDNSLIEKAFLGYWDTNKDESWEDKCMRRDKKIFVMTWEDSLSNLSKVLTRLKKNNKCPEILAQKITPVIRKGRRDVYIFTENNLLFREIYNKTLNDLQAEYANK